MSGKGLHFSRGVPHGEHWFDGKGGGVPHGGNWFDDKGEVPHGGHWLDDKGGGGGSSWGALV